MVQNSVLALTFAALALTFFFWVYANVAAIFWVLFGVIAGLTITWFCIHEPWENVLVVLPKRYSCY